MKWGSWAHGKGTENAAERLGRATEAYWCPQGPDVSLSISGVS